MFRTLAVLIASLLLTAALAQPPRKRRNPADAAPLLPRKELLLAFGSGFRQMLADYYWIQTTAQMGKAATRYEYRDIYWYADMATDLDPNFHYVYVFGATAMTYNLGREVWVNTEESTRLIRKGLDQFPNDVYLRMILAYNLSYYHRRPLEAARLLEETSRLPGAPSYLPALATRLYAQGGSFDSGIAVAQQLARNARDEETRKLFERRVLEIQLERILQEVDRAIAQFKAREGREPAQIEQLKAAGDLLEVPADPLGGKIVIGPDGRGRSTAAQDRLEIYGGYSNQEEQSE